jgi:queuine tRNA-ribosyltransferase
MVENGMLFTSKGVINIKNKKWEKDFSPIDEGIENEMSSYYSKSYLRHLFVSGEILGLQLASIQNLSFYLWLVTEARNQILGNNFSAWKSQILPIISQRL